MLCHKRRGMNFLARRALSGAVLPDSIDGVPCLLQTLGTSHSVKFATYMRWSSWTTMAARRSCGLVDEEHVVPEPRRWCSQRRLGSRLKSAIPSFLAMLPFFLQYGICPGCQCFMHSTSGKAGLNLSSLKPTVVQGFATLAK